MPQGRDTVERLRPDPAFGFQFEEDPIGYIDVDTFTDGMETSTPRGKVQKGATELARNARTRDGGTRRRPGTVLYSNAENEDVLSLIPFSNENFRRIVRVTRARISVDEGAGTWVDYDIGTFHARFSHAAFIDNLYIGNGESAIRQLDFSAKTANPMADAPAARFLMNFAERIVGANVPGEPYRVQWPVNRDPTDWTGTGSGFELLISERRDLSDDIVGLFDFESQAIILRRKSLWLMERLPSSTTPFKFTKIFDKFGCDLPHTAISIPGGVLFGNYSRGAVYYFTPGSSPQEITRNKIRDRIFSDVKDLNYTQAVYDEFHDEYHLGEAYTEGSPSMRTFRIYCPAYNSWVEDDGPECTAMAWADSATGALYIDDLVGTINSQVGFINELISDDERFTALFKAEPGDVFYQDDDATLNFNGADFELELILPNLGGLHNKVTLQDFGASVLALAGCNVVIEVSKDKTNWTKTKNLILDPSPKEQKVLYKKHRVTGADLYIRVKASGGDFDVRTWWARLLQKSQHR